MKNLHLQAQETLVGWLLDYTYENDNPEPTIGSETRIWNVLNFIFSSKEAPHPEHIIAKIYNTGKTNLEKVGHYRFSQKQLSCFRSWLSHKDQASLLSSYMVIHQKFENRTAAQKVADNYNNDIQELALAIIELQNELKKVREECKYWQERVPFLNGEKNFLNK